MADDATTQGASDAEAVFRPCPFCGASIHPSSHRCPECGGHVGLAWGTVHRELFLFVFSAVLVGVGCLSSWRGRSPDGFVGSEISGLDTIRGTLMFALAVYGLVVGMLNVLYRRMVVWPFLLNALLALWVGFGGILEAVGSQAWKAWGTWAEGKSMFESWFGAFRAVPPSCILLALAGSLVLVKLVGGILSAATSGKGKGEAPKSDATSRRRSSKATDAAGGADAPPPTV